jgi:hypothetical protein
MKINSIILFIVLSAGMVSCEKLKLSTDCYDEKPVEGELTIKVSVPPGNEAVGVNIYRGKYENNMLLFTDSVRDKEITYFLPVNSFYTVSAEYERDNKTIFVIDGGKISVKKQTNDDGSVCWNLYNVSIDLRLK